MKRKTGNLQSAEDKAVGCLAHGIAHAHAEFGRKRLGFILGTIAIDLVASGETTAPAGMTVKSGLRREHQQTTGTRLSQ
jgi:hypothetical protein